MNQLKKDLDAIIQYASWAVLLVATIDASKKPLFLKDITSVFDAFLLAVRKVSLSTLIFGGDPFKPARLLAYAIKDKWDSAS